MLERLCFGAKKDQCEKGFGNQRMDVTPGLERGSGMFLFLEWRFLSAEPLYKVSPNLEKET